MAASPPRLPRLHRLRRPETAVRTRQPHAARAPSPSKKEKYRLKLATLNDAALLKLQADPHETSKTRARAAKATFLKTMACACRVCVTLVTRVFAVAGRCGRGRGG